MLKFLKQVMARKRFDDPAYKPGGFFDTTSYVGNVRGAVFGLLCIFVSRYVDLWGQVLWPLFGETLNITNGRMQFHARVGLYMGLFILTCGVLLCIAIFQRYRTPSRYDREAAERQIETEIALRLQERAARGLDTPSVLTNISSAEQRLRETIWRWRFLHDLIWGWPFLLALSLLVWGHTLDGSPAAALIELFHWPSLDFFTLGRTPVSALNGIVFGALAYGANHALSKTSRIPFLLKLVLNVCVGISAISAWYALTAAMGAPI
jgi:hypothetical protein